MFRSRSLQSASYESPRAILYGSDARFIVTFNGAGSLSGSDRVETMEFDEKTETFHFREIAFPPAGEGGEVSISGDNPYRCSECHGSPARPIWDAYPTWPGAYGEHEHEAPGPVEREGLAAFLKVQAASPRYRNLVGAQALAKTDVSAARSIENTYEGVFDRPSSNAWFGLLLNRLNFRSIAGEVTSAPGFPRYAYGLLAALDPQCGDASSVVPHGSSSRPDAALATSSVTAEALSRFRFVVEEGLGLSTAGWSLAREKGTFDFATVRPTVVPLEVALLDVVSRKDRDVRALFATRGQSDAYCSYLMTRANLLSEGHRALRSSWR
jgi:hypothetical protein